MKKIETELKDCYIIEPHVAEDHRGYFERFYSEKDFKEIGIDVHFVEGNESFTVAKNTLRGMHYQLGDTSQTKLVRCSSGKIYDVVVDLRKDSPTYKKWIRVELSSENKRLLLIPKGFAHGFLTISDNVTFCYEVDEFYSKEFEDNFLWNDSEIGIDWGLPEGVEPILSERDKNAPLFKDCKADFTMDITKKV